MLIVDFEELWTTEFERNWLTASKMSPLKKDRYRRFFLALSRPEAGDVMGRWYDQGEPKMPTLPQLGRLLGAMRHQESQKKWAAAAHEARQPQPDPKGREARAAAIRRIRESLP